MKKLHIEIMKPLEYKFIDFDSLYKIVEGRAKLGPYGLNGWNFTKALYKLIALGYVKRAVDNDIFWYILTKKGSKYLCELKKVKER